MRTFRIASASLVVAALLAAAGAAQAAGTDNRITAEQRARLAERLTLVEHIARVVEPDLRASEVAAERRQWMLESLYMMPLEKLHALGVPGSFRGVGDAIAAAHKTTLKAIGDASSDLVYRPITPCRYIDTRNVGGPITSPRSYDLSLTGDVYGGILACSPVAASGVGNVDEIAAVSINVAIVSPAFQPGFLGVRPVGSSNSTAFVNWYQSGPTVQASNSGVVTTAQGVGNDIEFFGTQTEIVVDVMGVFTRPNATALQCQTKTTNGAGTGNLPTNTEYSFPLPTVCDAGYTAIAVSCEYGPVSLAGLALISVGPANPPGFYSCLWRNSTGSTLNQSDFHTDTRCCRVPGR